MLVLTEACSERQEQKVYEELIRAIPGFDERLLNSTEEEIMYIADQVCLFEFQAACEL